MVILQEINEDYPFPACQWVMEEKKDKKKKKCMVSAKTPWREIPLRTQIWQKLQRSKNHHS